MIDIHSHVLWGMDDGAQSLEESLAMLKLAAESGTTDIVATPHAHPRYPFRPDLIRQRLQQLSDLPESPHPRIHTGCDFHLSYENVQDALRNPAPYLINGGPYLLVEFPDTSLAGMGPSLGALLNRGFIPIITHPERNPLLRRISAEFLEWIDQGCLVQVTAQSLLGRFGHSAEESSWEMLERRLVHFVASDAHDTDHRPPRLDQAFQAIAARLGDSQARTLLVANPRAVISGQPISVPPPKKKSWFRW